MVKTDSEKVEIFADQFIETQEKINNFIYILKEINIFEEKARCVKSEEIEVYEFLDRELTFKIAKLVERRRVLLNAIKANL